MQHRPPHLSVLYVSQLGVHVHRHAVGLAHKEIDKEAVVHLQVQGAGACSGCVLSRAGPHHLVAHLPAPVQLARFSRQKKKKRKDYASSDRYRL